MSDPVVPTSDADSPAVVAVVVTQSPAVDLDATLWSLQQQDYPNLRILVIDDGGDSPLADRVAAVVPDAFYHRLSRPVGFAGAANHAATLVTGGSFLLFCTDRVDLDPRCVRSLVEELYRSNAGVVTPKSRQWDDPRRLESIGMGSDRFGVQVDLVESGDFDQEQYDAVADVFVAPAGVQLVRADLFRALDGFDPAMGSVNEDLDLCWRAHLAGARVVAVPTAVVKRRELPFTDAERRPLERHRLRTLLVTQSRLTLLWLLPLAVLQLVVGGMYSLLSGHRSQATVAVDAVAWNVARWGDTRKRRRAMQTLRQVSDSEVHALQFGGSARVNTFLRGQFAVGDRVVNLVTTARDAFGGPNADRVRDAGIVGALVGSLMLFGSRDLIAQGVTPVGQFLELPGAGRLLGEWSSGWRAAGTGGPGTAPTAFLVLGLLRVLFFWADGVPALLLALGPIVAGTIGAWTLVRPLGSARAAALASLSYVANPLLVDIVHAGRWNALVVWAAGPALLASALRLQGRAPYGRVGGTMHHAVVDRAVATRVLRLGLLVAVVCTFVPAFVLVALGVLFAVGFSSLIVARPVGLARLGVGAVGAVVVP
ncbi:MAG: glycosyltransferase, partial [Actinomycetota bacterium]|nr:glycosyltransferase [Actinomycetota bacterium]